MSIEDNGGLRVLAINILGRFLSNRDNNIRFSFFCYIYLDLIAWLIKCICFKVFCVKNPKFGISATQLAIIRNFLSIHHTYVYVYIYVCSWPSCHSMLRDDIFYLHLIWSLWTQPLRVQNKVGKLACLLKCQLALIKALLICKEFSDGNVSVRVFSSIFAGIKGLLVRSLYAWVFLLLNLTKCWNLQFN